MENENSQKRFESVYSNVVKAGKRRTYFFDVRQTKGDDYYITLTESTKRFNGNGFERHKIFLYKEDFNRFAEGLNNVIDHVKSNLMPDYDYDEFTRRHEEYERKMELENSNKELVEEAKAEITEPVGEEEESTAESVEGPMEEAATEENTPPVPKDGGDSDLNEENMSW